MNADKLVLNRRPTKANIRMIARLRRLRMRRLLPLITDQQAFYAHSRAPGEIRDWQLKQFNRQWQVVRCEVPYFARLVRERNLPAEFSSWEEFRDLMPVMDRRTIQSHRQALANETKPPDFFRTTGGSTAEPVQLPAWNSELQYANQDMWYARSWFGIEPSDKLFLIWGHSHLLGKGFRGWLNGVQRQIKDTFLGYYRYSAYDLSERGLREAAQALLAFKPAYLIAYAVALDRFARVNAHLRAAFQRLGLKAAIATAESFPRPDSAEFIADVLGCPVVMEYGAVETGPIAHQRPDGKFMVFWRHFFLEGYESEHLPGAYEILVTTLYPRCCPLVRYRIGDLISADPNDESFTQEFDAVIGRCNDYVILPNGDVVHSEAFTHAVKEAPSISAYQVVQAANGDITFYYVAGGPVSTEDIAEIRRRLARIHPSLADIRIEQVPSLEQTIAGKTRRIRRVESV